VGEPAVLAEEITVVRDVYDDGVVELAGLLESGDEVAEPPIVLRALLERALVVLLALPLRLLDLLGPSVRSRPPLASEKNEFTWAIWDSAMIGMSSTSITSTLGLPSVAPRASRGRVPKASATASDATQAFLMKLLLVLLFTVPPFVFWVCGHSL